MRRAVYAYLERSGKRLRPAVLLFSCGAVGGDEAKAIPAAAGVELFHTWTLVHDDLIDHDDTRRGGPSIHAMGRGLAETELGLGSEQAVDYGGTLSILAGDVQQGWTVCLFAELASRGVPAEVVLSLITRLESHVINAVIGGELLDVQYSRTPIDRLDEAAVLEMLRLKTGSLLEFAAMAGAMIGLGTGDVTHPTVEAIGRFALHCGTAFQLQDDLLGLLGDERTLGKPVGSDIREGKRTTLICYAFGRATPVQRRFLSGVLGNPRAGDADVAKAVDLLESVGAVRHTRDLAKGHIDQAIPCLERLAASESKELLLAWAEFMIRRQV
jgi:geranylgeranyl diphosphate synthase, type I